MKDSDPAIPMAAQNCIERDTRLTVSLLPIHLYPRLQSHVIDSKSMRPPDPS